MKRRECCTECGCLKEQKKQTVLDKVLAIFLLLACVVFGYLNPDNYVINHLEFINPSFVIVLVFGIPIFARGLKKLFSGKVSDELYLGLAIVGLTVLGVLAIYEVIDKTANYFFYASVVVLFSVIINYTVCDTFRASERKTVKDNKSNVELKGEKLGEILSYIGLIVAVIVFCMSFFVFSEEIGLSITKAIGVLVLCAPCVNTFFVVLAVQSASKSADDNGILLKDVTVLEKIMEVEDVFLDTNIVLDENVTLEKTIAFDGEEDELLCLSASVLSSVEDGYKKAVLSAVSSIELSCESLEIFDGGVKGVVGGRVVEVVTPVYLEEKTNHPTPSVTRVQHSVLFVIIDGKLCGALLFVVNTTEPYKESLAKLKDFGVKTTYFSKDTIACTEKIGKDCKIDNLVYSLTDKEKEYAVMSKSMQNSGLIMTVTRKEGVNYGANIVVFEGDYKDNVPSVADVTVKSKNSRYLPFLFKLSKRVLSKIKFNTIITLCVSALSVLLCGVNLFSIPLASIIYAVLSGIVCLNSCFRKVK